MSDETKTETKPRSKAARSADGPPSSVFDMNLWQRLHGVMGDFDGLEKDGQVMGGGKYRFVSHDQVMSRVRPLLKAWRVLATASVQSAVQVGPKETTWFVTMRVTFRNPDRPDEIECVEGIGLGMDPQDKGPGKAMSYATKYAILKALCGTTGEDVDYTPSVGESDAPPPQRSVRHKAQGDPRQEAIDLIREWSGITDPQDVFAAVRDVATKIGVTPSRDTTPDEWAKVRDGARKASEKTAFEDFVKGNQ